MKSRYQVIMFFPVLVIGKCFSIKGIFRLFQIENFLRILHLHDVKDRYFQIV